MGSARQIDQFLPAGLAWMSEAADREHDESNDAPLRLLLLRAKTGELEAFEQLIVLHEQRVFRTALRLVRNVEDAQDAAQEVFLRLHKHLARFDDERSFHSWLYRIVVNVCHDLNRRRGRYPTTALEESAGGLDPATTEKDPFELASLEQQRRLVAQSLASLSEKERGALVLRELEGLSTAEVARILGSTEGTVRSQICTARIKIKKFRDRYLRRPK